MKKFQYVFFAALAAVLMALAGCGGDDGSDSGTVQLALTDAVDSKFSQVVISIKEIRAVPAGEEGAGEEGLPLIVSFETPMTVNVLDLAFQQELLGEAVLNAGTYNQLRLVLESNTNTEAPANYVVMADDLEGVKLPLFTPGGEESGLKVVGKFDVTPGEVSAVVLDFDPSRAIGEPKGVGYLFKPTGIRVVQTDRVLLNYAAVAGSLVQEVEDATGTLTQVPVTQGTVYAYPEGSETAIAAGSVNIDDGTFRLFLPEGWYEIRATADGFEPLSTAPIEVIENLQDAEAGELVMVPVQETTEAL